MKKNVFRLYGVTALALAAGLFAAGCGFDNGASREQIEQAREQGAQKAREEAKVKDLQRQIKQLQRGQKQSRKHNKQTRTTPAPSMSPAKYCGDGIGASSATSCDFAFNVAGEYGSNPGASTIGAYSPVTGKHYTMSCSPMSGWSAVCTGGAGAAVFIP